jgi:hypothetical protein
VQTVVPDLDEARRQHVLHETREHLLAWKGNGFTVLGAESDTLLVHAQQALIGDTNAMSVSPEITNHLLGAAKRTLGVNDPALFPKRTQVDIAQIDVPATVSAFERIQHLSTKKGAHDPDRKEEFGGRAHPARAIGS